MCFVPSHALVILHDGSNYLLFLMSCVVIAFCLCNIDTMRYDTRYYFNERSKADMSQLNLPHGSEY